VTGQTLNALIGADFFHVPSSGFAGDSLGYSRQSVTGGSEEKGSEGYNRELHDFDVVLVISLNWKLCCHSRSKKGLKGAPAFANSMKIIRICRLFFLNHKTPAVHTLEHVRACVRTKDRRHFEIFILKFQSEEKRKGEGRKRERCALQTSTKGSTKEDKSQNRSIEVSANEASKVKIDNNCQCPTNLKPTSKQFETAQKQAIILCNLSNGLLYC
jgi:hypothetical protein